MKPALLSLALCATMVIGFTSCNDTNDATDDSVNTTALTDGTMTVDTSASRVGWAGTMVGMYEHKGTVELNSGSLVVENGEIKGGKLEVDLKTIQPLDNNFKPEQDRTPEKLVGHLTSDDFFNVAEYPTAEYEITGSEGSTIMGNLTIRGKTFPEKVENVQINEENGMVTFTGKLTFDRTKYDVSFKHPMQEMVLSNDVQLDVKLVASN
jgi:polyisoprenoid-binding protein YceI